MNAEKYQSHPCPKCGTPNLGTELQVHRGLKCVSCGTGYIPVVIEPRGFEQKESPAALLVLGAFVVILAIVFGFISIWLTLAIAAVGLLAGIFILLLRAKKSN
ncbi:MAG: hypothetical protein ABSH15_04365 [Verrucomicrobiota bacterium]|jgi:uncharacterized paraquat-inducible protein A